MKSINFPFRVYILWAANLKVKWFNNLIVNNLSRIKYIGKWVKIINFKHLLWGKIQALSSYWGKLPNLKLIMKTILKLRKIVCIFKVRSNQLMLLQKLYYFWFLSLSIRTFTKSLPIDFFSRGNIGTYLLYLFYIIFTWMSYLEFLFLWCTTLFFNNISYQHWFC